MEKSKKNDTIIDIYTFLKDMVVAVYEHVIINIKHLKTIVITEKYIYFDYILYACYSKSNFIQINHKCILNTGLFVYLGKSKIL